MMSLSRTSFKLLTVFLLIGGFSKAHAAACCGGAFATPSLILGDDKALFTAMASSAQVDTDVDSRGYWSSRPNPQTVETFRLDGAHLISDRWQVGANLPLIFNRRDNPSGDSSGSGLGDLSMSVGFEALPEWDYSSWRPKGTAFAQVIVPTGKSVYESSNVESLDVTGRGLYSIGLGMAFTKIISSWDTMLLLQGHRSLNRSISSPAIGGTVELHPGWGALVQAQGGYNLKDFRFGAGLGLNYEDPIRLTGSATESGAVERYVTGSLSVAYLMKEDWAAALSYSDNRLFGSPVNTTLGSTVTLALQKRWPR
jgi:hypothetical protein